MVTREKILKVGFSAEGGIFANTASKPTMNLKPLKFSLEGNPYYGIDSAQHPSGNIKRILKVDFSYVKKVINVEG